MPEEKLRNIYCGNKNCKKLLCESDGVFLFVEKLKIEPKIFTKRICKGGNEQMITCDECGWQTSVWLKKLKASDKPDTQPGRKFLIFRSRFD